MSEEVRAALVVLRERRNWLTERIKAKEQVGWETAWDERERDALARIIDHLEAR